MLASSQHFKETNMSQNTWIVYSGATHHVSNSKNLCLDFKPLTDTFDTLPNVYTISIVGIDYIE